MRFAIIAVAVALSGCAVTKMQLAKPYAIARIDSAKMPADFAQCVARALGEPVRNEAGSTIIYVHNRTNIRIARWDFIATANGSQAELRASAKYEPPLDEVRACA
jgi:hypothetical protein